MTRRIGLYGGCFNPVHEGHLAAARGACYALALDTLLFIPSGHPPLKGNSGLADGQHRLAMIEHAITGDPRLAVSAIEIDREGPSFTVDTVSMLRSAYPADAEMFFLLGDDCIDRLPRWKGIDELHTMVRFAVLPRTGAQAKVADSRLIWLPLAPFSVSSTEVRAMVVAGALPPSRLVPEAVTEYIAEHALYASSAGRPAFA